VEVEIIVKQKMSRSQYQKENKTSIYNNISM
jgi:hypothetical protein